jgi:hypothetical protein
VWRISGAYYFTDEDRIFLIDEQLMPRIGSFEGNMSFIWRDPDETDAGGSSSDENLYEFVVDGRRTDGATFGAFYEAILRGIYEHKNRHSSIAMTLPELKELFDKCAMFWEFRSFVLTFFTTGIRSLHLP